MIYYKENELTIRSMIDKDISALSQGFYVQGWHKPVTQFKQYFIEQNDQKRQVFVAEVKGDVAGYVTLLPKALVGPFIGIPEVCDFNVLIKFQNQGIGSKLLDVVECEVKKTSHLISLGVGLHSGYGKAQRMYVKRGYIPDGSGVWYEDKQLEQYVPCCNDDELVLYLSKQLNN